MNGRDDVTALIPPSVADLRGRAFGRLMARAAADIRFRDLLFERIDTVDASVLPFLVREFSLEEFVEPGMSEAIIRDLLKASYDLHATKGFIHGVRRGLLMLGMRVVWKQWFQQVPPGAPGTHVATVFVNRTVFDGQVALLDERVQRAAQRMIAGMKRHSQDVVFQLAVAIVGRASAASALQAASLARKGTNAAPPTTADASFGAAGAIQSAGLSAVSATAAPQTGLAARQAVAGAVRAISIIAARMEAA